MADADLICYRLADTPVSLQHRWIDVIKRSVLAERNLEFTTPAEVSDALRHVTDSRLPESSFRLILDCPRNSRIRKLTSDVKGSGR